MTELSAAVPSGFSCGMREVLLPALTDLYDATHEAVHLTVRCGDIARVVERVHGRRSVGLVTQFRSALPLHCTAAGKILLAASPSRTTTCLIACRPTRPRRSRRPTGSVRSSRWSAGTTSRSTAANGPPVFPGSPRRCGGQDAG